MTLLKDGSRGRRVSRGGGPFSSLQFGHSGRGQRLYIFANWINQVVNHREQLSSVHLQYIKKPRVKFNRSSTASTVIQQHTLRSSTVKKPRGKIAAISKQSADLVATVATVPLPAS
jgi:hypothetical protein